MHTIIKHEEEWRIHNTKEAEDRGDLKSSRWTVWWKMDTKMVDGCQEQTVVEGGSRGSRDS